MIRPEVIYLFIPHCDPYFLADKLDSVERVGEPGSVLDQSTSHERTHLVSLSIDSERKIIRRTVPQG